MGRCEHALSVVVERELDRDMDLTTHWLVGAREACEDDKTASDGLGSVLQTKDSGISVVC